MNPLRTISEYRRLGENRRALAGTKGLKELAEDDANIVRIIDAQRSAIRRKFGIIAVILAALTGGAKIWHDHEQEIQNGGETDDVFRSIEKLRRAVRFYQDDPEMMRTPRNNTRALARRKHIEPTKPELNDWVKFLSADIENTIALISHLEQINKADKYIKARKAKGYSAAHLETILGSFRKYGKLNPVDPEIETHDFSVTYLETGDGENLLRAVEMVLARSMEDVGMEWAIRHDIPYYGQNGLLFISANAESTEDAQGAMRNNFLFWAAIHDAWAEKIKGQKGLAEPGLDEFTEAVKQNLDLFKQLKEMNDIFSEAEIIEIFAPPKEEFPDRLDRETETYFRLRLYCLYEPDMLSWVREKIHRIVENPHLIQLP